MKKRNYAAGVIVFSACVLGAQANDVPALPSEPHVVVAATGRATTTPDYLDLTMQVVMSREDGPEAKAAVDTTTKAVLAALRELGIQRQHVTTSQMTLEIVRDYDRDAPRIVGYQAGRTIEIELRNMAILDQLVEGVTAAGVTSIWRPRVRSNIEAEMQQQALNQAIMKARSEAQSLATAAGRGLGPVYGIATYEARTWRGSGGGGSLFGDPADDDDDVEDWLTWVPPHVEFAKSVYVVFLLGPASQRESE